MPELVRLYIRSVLIGFALSAAFAVVMIWQDVMGVGHLILASPVGWIAVLMMFIFNGALFASVQFGLRVMLMAEDDEGPKGGLRDHLPLVPVRAEATAPASAPRRAR